MHSSTFKHNASSIAGFGCAYLLAHYVAFLFPDTEKVLVAVWPAGGIGLAALLLSPRRLWPAILAAMFVAGNTANLLVGRPLFNSIGFMLANILESLACAWLIIRWCGEEVKCTRVKEIVSLLCAAIFVNAVTACIGAATAAASGTAPFWSFWKTWWIADGLGIILIAPLIVTWSNLLISFSSIRWNKAIEAGVFLVLWCVATRLTFQLQPNGPPFVLEPYMLLALLSWAALRLGQRTVTLSLVILSVMAITSKMVITGPLLWGGDSLTERVLLMQMFIACTAVTGFLLTASSAESISLESELQTQNKTFSQVLNELDSLVYVADMKTYEIVFINTYGQNIWGDVKGKICWQTLQEAQAGPCEFCTNSKLIGPDGNPTEGVVWEFLNTFNNRWYDCRDRAIYWPDGHIVRMEIASDITDRKRNVEALRNRDEIFSLFMKHSPFYIYFKQVTSTESLVLQASDNFQQMIGIHGSKMIGKTMPELFPAEMAAKITADDWRVVANGEVMEFEEDFNGHNYFTTKFPIVQGDKTFLAGYSIDISERKKAEAEKQSLEERLQNAEKLEMMGKLAGRVAHDLNNVLGVLSGYSELLTERIPEGNPLREYAANILKSSGRAAAIVEDLLTLARRGVRVMEVVKLNKIIANLIAAPEVDKLAIYHPTVIVKTDLAKDLLNITGSPVHLEKTILNLLSNAVEAITDSGEVFIRTENRYLDKAIEGYQTVIEGEYVVLTLSDTGKGIPTSELKSIFEPFYTRKSMGQSGTGLGLAIVWGAVQDHNGYIDVQSIEGKGTTFTLYFPATREKSEVETQKIPIEQYVGHGESVLVVDDVQEQRNVATALLMQLGYQVNAVSSGAEAVEYLKTNKADILVLDMIMEPGIDGLDTYKLVRESNPHQKAIIVSGFSETDRSKEAQKLGAGPYVKKPYLKERIGIAIRDELARK